MVVGSLVGIMNKAGIIVAKVHLLASRQISGSTLYGHTGLRRWELKLLHLDPLQTRVPVRIDLPNHVGQSYLTSGRLPTTILGGRDVVLNQSVNS